MLEFANKKAVWVPPPDAYCPHCDRGLIMNPDDHDYAKQFDMDCPECGKSMEVFVDMEPHYTVVKSTEERTEA